MYVHSFRFPSQIETNTIAFISIKLNRAKKKIKKKEKKKKKNTRIKMHITYVAEYIKHRSTGVLTLFVSYLN